VVISSLADYNMYLANATLSDATELGPVVITWPTINTQELTMVLQNKTSLGGLVIESCLSITSLSPALDSLTTISAGLVLDNLISLRGINLMNVSSIGSDVRIYSNSLVSVVALPLVEHLGALFIDGCSAVRVVSFQNLTTVNGSWSLRNMPSLSGSAISDGFPSLTTVEGTLTLYVVSWAGNPARSPLSLPLLQSVGGWYARQAHFTSVSCPALQSIGGPPELHNFGGRGELGTFYWYNLPNLRAMHFESLQFVSGKITIASVGMLSNLCSLIGLPPAGYHSRNRVRLSNALACFSCCVIGSHVCVI
jgi:hypothetical protein